MSTRSNLLDIAERLARSLGYNAFSYADLAEEAGIRKASIHHHFPLKADLAVALMARYRENFMNALAQISEANARGSERLLGFVEAYRTALCGGKSLCLCVAFSANRDSLSDGVQSEIAAFHGDCLAWLQSCFDLGQKDGSIPHVAQSCRESIATMALVEGAQLIARASGDLSKFDDAVSMLTNRIASQ